MPTLDAAAAGGWLLSSGASGLAAAASGAARLPLRVVAGLWARRGALPQTAATVREPIVASAVPDALPATPGSAHSVLLSVSRAPDRLVSGIIDCEASGAWVRGDVSCCLLICAAALFIAVLCVALLARFMRNRERAQDVKHLLQWRDANVQQCRPPPTLLPPRSDKHRSDLTVVFDLDETLIAFGDDAFDEKGAAGVRHRPGLAELGECLRELDCEVVVWTAATEPYARAVLQSFRRGGRELLTVHHTVHRSTGSWWARGGKDGHTKDLRLLGRDLPRTLMIENRPLSCIHQKGNCLLVPDYKRPPQRRGGRCAARTVPDCSLEQVQRVIAAAAASRRVDSVLQLCRAIAHPPAADYLPGEKGHFHCVKSPRRAPANRD